MIKKIREKYNTKGYTLTELLCVIVVLLLVTSCLTLGINLCNSSLNKITTVSGIQILSQNLTELISDELRFARHVTNEGGNVKFQSWTHGYDTEIKCDSNGHIIITSPDESAYPLLASSAYVKGSTVKNFKISYDQDSQLFTVSFDIVSGEASKSTAFNVKAFSNNEYYPKKKT